MNGDISKRKNTENPVDAEVFRPVYGKGSCTGYFLFSFAREPDTRTASCFLTLLPAIFTSRFLTFITMKLFCFFCCLLVLSFVSLRAQTPSPVVPDFRFLQKNGQAFTRQQLAKNKTLFFVFFDISCEHCQQALQYLEVHYRQLTKAAIYLLTLDPGPQAEAFLQAKAPRLFRLPNTLLLRDRGNQFIRLFQPRKYPSLFLYSAKQELLLYSDEEKDLDAFVKRIGTGQ